MSDVTNLAHSPILLNFAIKPPEDKSNQIIAPVIHNNNDSAPHLNKAEDIEAALTDMSDERQAAVLMRFFKTAPGEYGHGDRFAGIRNPQVRMVVKEAWRDTPLAEAARLVGSPVHEVRLCGLLIMVEQYLHAMKKGRREPMEEIVDSYLALHPHINNWDLVDLSAIKIIGNHEAAFPDFRLMDQWITPEGHTIWQQRISMVSTWILTRHGMPQTCFHRAAHLAAASHDLLHKAAGWMLRETWKQGYRDQLRDFLDKNVQGMPAIMLSYACEQMPLDERHRWQMRRKLTSGR